MQPLHSGVISIPGSPKTRSWKQSSILAPQITEKSQKGTQSDSQGTPQMILKSLKIYTWTSKCLLGDPLDPWITKMVSQVPKMEPQGLQNNSFTYKKLPISAVDQLTYQHMLFGGPAAGGEALK
jgi:hypothetical protein